MLREWTYVQVLDILPDSQITDAKILQAGTYAMNIPGVDTTPEPPFIMMRGGTWDPRGSQLGRSQRFQLWVHDAPGSYTTNIEPILLALADGLPSRAPAVYKGWNITACEFEGTSDDLFDPDKQTAVRYGVFRVTGRPLGSA